MNKELYDNIKERMDRLGLYALKNFDMTGVTLFKINCLKEDERLFYAEIPDVLKKLDKYEEELKKDL